MSRPKLSKSERKIQFVGSMQGKYVFALGGKDKCGKIAEEYLLKEALKILSEDKAE